MKRLLALLLCAAAIGCEAGNLLMYYGIEGISYEMVDGYPYFTDFVKNNPDGIPFAQILSQYDYSPATGPYRANGD